ncbi:MAG: [protein-PII] uridylyltransferase [Acidimicrobiales bacterium]
MDAWVADLFAQACGPRSSLCLVAVGSFGRRELCPRSDLDLVLLHDGRQPAKDVSEVAERLWYPIWDAKIGLDHSVRTVPETLATAGRDLKAALGLLDARLVAGDAELFRQLADRGRRLWEDRASSLLSRLHESVVERHTRHGEVAFLLEPELKEGRGGLRDVVALKAAIIAKPGVGPVPAEVNDARDLLLCVRAALHTHARRPLDRLVLQEQDAVAADLGIHDADQLMAMVAGSARAIARCSDRVWRKAAILPAARNPRRRRPPVTVGPGIILYDGEVALSPGGPTPHPAEALRLAGAAAELNAPIAPEAIDALAATTALSSATWPVEVLDAFISLLGWGPCAIMAFEALDQAGVVESLLPEWQNVRNRPQRNAYHRFTVDRHLLETAAQAATLSREVSRPDLLLLASLLHDLGKGHSGDHSVVGANLAASVSARMGLSGDDAAVVTRLVRHHLLLADVATRRDPTDPATLATVAAAVGDVATLELLAALTQADGKATGPLAWTPWKETLVADLVARVRQELEGMPAPSSAPYPSPSDRVLMQTGQTTVRIGSTTTVIAPDRTGLLARVAAALAGLGLEVRAARAASVAGMAIEQFEVAPNIGEWPPDETVRARIEDAVGGSADVDAILARRRDTYRPLRRRAATAVPPRVLFDRSGLSGTEVVEVRCLDRPGILAELAAALSNIGLDVVQARAATLGHEVVDAFYVRSVDGRLLEDGQRAQVVDALLAVADLGP